MTARCASCALTSDAAQLRATAALLDVAGRGEDAAAARTEAARLDAAPCSWWWRVKGVEEDAATGQEVERVAEGCGRALLPRFLNDFGHSTLLAAKSVQTATSEAARAADGAALVVVAAGRLEAAVERHGDRLATVALLTAGEG